MDSVQSEVEIVVYNLTHHNSMELAHGEDYKTSELNQFTLDWYDINIK